MTCNEEKNINDQRNCFSHGKFFNKINNAKLFVDNALFEDIVYVVTAGCQYTPIYQYFASLQVLILLNNQYSFCMV